jgi:hypothetical protein
MDPSGVAVGAIQLDQYLDLATLPQSVHLGSESRQAVPSTFAEIWRRRSVKRQCTAKVHTHTHARPQTPADPETRADPDVVMPNRYVPTEEGTRVKVKAL